MEKVYPPIIGVMGGIASGKTFVTECFQRNGAAVISADQAAHEVLAREDVKQQVREHFGGAVLAADGTVDRAKLGEIVFAPPPDGPRELAFLERLIHPRVGDMLKARLIALRGEAAVPAIVLDVPLLFESGWNTVCDEIVFVDAPRSVREARAQGRGWTREEFARRESAQQSVEEKRRLASTVVDNSQTAENTQEQVNRIWQALRLAGAAR